MFHIKPDRGKFEREPVYFSGMLRRQQTGKTQPWRCIFNISGDFLFTAITLPPSLEKPGGGGELSHRHMTSAKEKANECKSQSGWTSDVSIKREKEPHITELALSEYQLPKIKTNNGNETKK